MDFQQIRKYVKGVLTNSFLNKTTLDKLSTSNAGNLLFDGKEINSNSVEWNQIQTKGVKIAEVTIDGTATEIFAPNGGEGSGEISAPNGGKGLGIMVDTLIDTTITTTNSYELSASIDNYDMLIVTGMTHINSSDYEQLNSLIIMKDDYYIEAVDGWSHSLNFSISGNTRRAVFNFNDGKLNVVKIENAALKKIYGIKFVSQQHEYSTEEKIVGKWIDGKPIYEKVINGGYLPNSSSISIDVSNLNIDSIIQLKGITFTDDKLNQRPITLGTSDSNAIRIDFTNNNIRIFTWSNWSAYNSFIIIQYTKTTD